MIKVPLHPATACLHCYTTRSRISRPPLPIVGLFRELDPHSNNEAVTVINVVWLAHPTTVAVPEWEQNCSVHDKYSQIDTMRDSILAKMLLDFR